MMENAEQFKFIGGIPSTHVNEIWPLVAPLLAKALNYDNSGMRLKDLKEEIDADQMQLWVVADDSIRCAAVTKISQSIYGTKYARILYLGGDSVNEWLAELLDIIEPWAKEHGCTIIEAVGRRGWEKVGKQFGYKHAYTVIQKDL